MTRWWAEYICYLLYLIVTYCYFVSCLSLEILWVILSLDKKRHGQANLCVSAVLTVHPCDRYSHRIDLHVATVVGIESIHDSSYVFSSHNIVQAQVRSKHNDIVSFLKANNDTVQLVVVRIKQSEIRFRGNLVASRCQSGEGFRAVWLTAQISCLHRVCTPRTVQDLLSRPVPGSLGATPVLHCSSFSMFYLVRKASPHRTPSILRVSIAMDQQKCTIRDKARSLRVWPWSLDLDLLGLR